MKRSVYWLKEVFHKVSSLVIGNYLEPETDIVLITGGTGGLGKEIATGFVNEHARVVVFDIIVPPIEDRVPTVTYYKCDVSKRDEVLECQKAVMRDIGRVTILINNAGITTGKPVLDLTYDEIEKTVQINLLSSFYTIKAFLPDMLQVKRGYIITIASVLGYMSPARLSAYGASKSGLIALHESLTYELGSPSLNSTGIKTLLVCPGQLKTGMFQGVKSPSSLFAPELDPKYVASSVVSAVTIGRRGEIKLPFYGKFLPVFRAFPWPIVELVRYVSGIDKSMKSFKGAVSKLASKATSKAASKSNSIAGSTAHSPNNL